VVRRILACRCRSRCRCPVSVPPSPQGPLSPAERLEVASGPSSGAWNSEKPPGPLEGSRPRPSPPVLKTMPPSGAGGAALGILPLQGRTPPSPAGGASWGPPRGGTPRPPRPPLPRPRSGRGRPPRGRDVAGQSSGTPGPRREGSAPRAGPGPLETSSCSEEVRSGVLSPVPRPTRVAQVVELCGGEEEVPRVRGGAFHAHLRGHGHGAPPRRPGLGTGGRAAPPLLPSRGSQMWASLVAHGGSDGHTLTRRGHLLWRWSLTERGQGQSPGGRWGLEGRARSRGDASPWYPGSPPAYPATPGPSQGLTPAAHTRSGRSSSGAAAATPLALRGPCRGRALPRGLSPGVSRAEATRRLPPSPEGSPLKAPRSPTSAGPQPWDLSLPRAPGQALLLKTPHTLKGEGDGLGGQGHQVEGLLPLRSCCQDRSLRRRLEGGVVAGAA